MALGISKYEFCYIKWLNIKVFHHQVSGSIVSANCQPNHWEKLFAFKTHMFSINKWDICIPYLHQWMVNPVSAEKETKKDEEKFENFLVVEEVSKT